MEKYIKLFEGGSFTKTFLIKKNNFIIRKEISLKNKNNPSVIKDQYLWLKFMHNKNLLVPKVIEFKKEKDKHFYEMEYINTSKNVAKNLRNIIKKKLFLKLLNKIDNHHKAHLSIKRKNKKLFSDLVNKKVLNSISTLQKKKLGRNILKKKYIKINNEECLNIADQLKFLIKKKSNFAKILSNNFDSKFKTLIHGDLTFENILMKKNKFYFIDPLGGNVDVNSKKNIFYKTTSLFDIGKINQSLMGKYESWKNISSVKNFTVDGEFKIRKISKNDKKNFEMMEKKFNYLTNNFFEISMMHMVIHLCRLIRYRVKHNYPSAIYAYVLATYVTHTLIKDFNYSQTQ